jgi:hypothetical protein
MLSSKPEFRCLRAAGRDPMRGPHGVSVLCLACRKRRTRTPQAPFSRKEFSGNCIPVRGPCSLVLGHAYWLAYCAKPPVALPSTTVNWASFPPSPPGVRFDTLATSRGCHVQGLLRTAVVSNLIIISCLPGPGPVARVMKRAGTKRAGGCGVATPSLSHPTAPPAARQPPAAMAGF